MNYKGFRFPKDVRLVLSIAFFSTYYSIAIHFSPIKRILDGISSLKSKNKTDGIHNGLHGELDKAWRACNWFLLKVLHSSKPCLRRSLVIYRWCCKRGIEASVSIGVRKKDTGLDGHSWVMINNAPYKESICDLKQYTCIMKG